MRVTAGVVKKRWPAGDRRASGVRPATVTELAEYRTQHQGPGASDLTSRPGLTDENANTTRPSPASLLESEEKHLQKEDWQTAATL